MADMSEDDVAMSAVDWSAHDAPSPSETIKSDGEMDDRQGDGGPSQPVQKRRRVTRACDECRRKKIKCDGKQPCTHCSVYSYGKFLICAQLVCAIPLAGGTVLTAYRMHI